MICKNILPPSTPTRSKLAPSQRFSNVSTQNGRLPTTYARSCSKIFTREKKERLEDGLYWMIMGQVQSNAGARGNERQALDLCRNVSETLQWGPGQVLILHVEAGRTWIGTGARTGRDKALEQCSSKVHSAENFSCQVSTWKDPLETVENIWVESTAQKAWARHGVLEASGFSLNLCVKGICAVTNGKSLKLEAKLGDDAAWEAL